MRHIISILTISLFILSCGQDENKKKELELKERELALKEKELAMKEKDSAHLKPNSAESKMTSTTENTTSDGYSFDNHNDINAFIKDLAKAVSENDKMTVGQMTNFPFIDVLGDNPGNNTSSLDCKNSEQFIQKYDKIFVGNLVKVIKSKKYSGWTEPEPPNYEEIINKGEYLIDAGVYGDREFLIGIKKINGKFKLYAMKFRS